MESTTRENEWKPSRAKKKRYELNFPHIYVVYITISHSNFVFPASSETQGQLVGAGKSLNRREKNSGEEKSRRRVRAPGDKVLTDQFQTVGAILASDWC